MKLTILGGPPKGAKSVLALEAAVSIASGTPFLEHGRVVEPGPVLVVSLEGGRWLATDRLEKICRHRALEMATLPVHVMDLGQLSRLRLDDARYMRGLMEAAQRFGPKMIILDPLVRLHGGSERARSGPEATPVARLISGASLIAFAAGLDLALAPLRRGALPIQGRRSRSLLRFCCAQRAGHRRPEGRASGVERSPST